MTTLLYMCPKDLSDLSDYKFPRGQRPRRFVGHILNIVQNVM